MNEEKLPLKNEIKKSLVPQSPLKSLRTYQGDIEAVIGQKNISIASIAIAEERRREHNREEIPTPSLQVKNKLFLTIGSILLVGGCVVVGVFYYIRSHSTTLVQVRTETLINYSKEIIVPTKNTSREELIRLITQNKKYLDLPVNSILYLSPGTLTPDVQNVIDFIAPNAPTLFSRSLDPDYMIGIYAYDVDAPFILLTTSDYARTYSGVLKWEDGMVSDLGEIFSIPNQTVSTPYVFHDESIRNKDLRFIRDQNDKTILVYGFLDPHTLLITQNENVFTALLGKFITTKMVR